MLVRRRLGESRGSLGGRSCELGTPACHAVPPVLDGARRSTSEGSTQAAATAGRAGHARVRGRRCRLWQRRQRFVGWRRRRRQRQGGRRNHAGRDEVRRRHRGEGHRDADQGRLDHHQDPRHRLHRRLGRRRCVLQVRQRQRRHQGPPGRVHRRGARLRSAAGRLVRDQARGERQGRRVRGGLLDPRLPGQPRLLREERLLPDRGRRAERVLQHAEHRRAEHGPGLLQPRRRALRDRQGSGEGRDGRRLSEAAGQRGGQPDRPVLRQGEGPEGDQPPGDRAARGSGVARAGDRGAGR